MEVISNNQQATQELAAMVGSLAKGGTVIGLYGQLGAGKTQFVKGLARGLGVPAARQVTSPTFIIVNEHVGKLTLYHVDAYRLGHWRELEQIGFDELLGAAGVVAIEWADRVEPLLPGDRLDVHMKVTGQFSRQIKLSAGGSVSQDLLEQVRLAYPADQQPIQ